MKIGLGLYRHMLTSDNFRFAKQAGASHIVAHLTDYFGKQVMPATDGRGNNWGLTDQKRKPWSYEELYDLKSAINKEGLELEALENLDPAFWYDILLDGPRKPEQIENLKTLIRNVGKVKIPIFGYYFSVAGVWGHSRGPWARGGADVPAYFGKAGPEEIPIPKGEVWNMVYDSNAPKGTIETVTTEQIWQRYTAFLKALVPVAEEAGVRLALHPDDPPMPSLRGAARLVYKPELFQRVLDTYPSYYNALEFCQGTTSEMVGEMNIYDAIDKYSRQGNIAYVHFRNVKGRVPHYYEVFVDEGYVDMVRAMQIYYKNGFDGLFVPDHVPNMTCGAPWHAGMAHCLGYMKGIIQSITSGRF